MGSSPTWESIGLPPVESMNLEQHATITVKWCKTRPKFLQPFFNECEQNSGKHVTSLEKWGDTGN